MVQGNVFKECKECGEKRWAPPDGPFATGKVPCSRCKYQRMQGQFMNCPRCSKQILKSDGMCQSCGYDTQVE